MTVPPADFARSQRRSHDVFARLDRAKFGSSYPEGPHKLKHALGDNPMLELASLAALAEALPEKSIEFNSGKQPIGVDGKPEATGLSIGETIRNIDSSDSWAVLKNIEQEPAYKQLLHRLLEELEPSITPRTGGMLKLQGFIFVSSPNAVTPYHFDPEHNILLQLRGTKEMTMFAPGNARFAPDEVHEGYHLGGGRELKWKEEFLEHGVTFKLTPGEALFVPVMAPHFVKNGPEPSISLSITWRSEWSFAESDARAFNKLLRRFGLKPKPPGRWPQSNLAKSYAWRALRRIPGIS